MELTLSKITDSLVAASSTGRDIFHAIDYSNKELFSSAEQDGTDRVVLTAKVF